MYIGLPNLGLNSFAKRWSPSDLWPTGTEPGMWLDMQDGNTGYQDSAGVTLDYAPGAGSIDPPVGLRLDKRLGATRGPDTVVNGGFASGANWSTEAEWAVGGGVATYTYATGATHSISQLQTISAGRSYEVTFDVTANTGNILIQATLNGVESSGTLSGVGTKRAILTAVAARTQLLFFASGTAGTISIDNVTMREVPGNHVLQATAAARPVWSGRVNDLLSTDGFAGATITPGTGLVVMTTGLPDQNGALTARQIRNTVTTEQHRLFTATSSSGKSEYTVRVKNVDAGFVQLSMAGVVVSAWSAMFNLSAGTLGSVLSTGALPTASITADGNGFWLCKLTPPTTETTINNVQLYVLESDPATTNPSTTGTAKSVIVAGASLAPAGSRYQSVGATAATYDTAGFPLFDKFDGVDDGYATAAFTAGTLTSNMDCFIAIKRNTAAAGISITNAPAGGQLFGFFSSGGAGAAVQGVGVGTSSFVNGVAVPGGALPTTGQLHTAMPVGEWLIYEVRNLDLSLWTAFMVANYAGLMPAVSVGEVILCPAHTEAMRTPIRKWMAANATQNQAVVV